MSAFAWCRACGAVQSEEGATACPSCQWPLADVALPASPIGLPFQLPGKMKVTKRLGVCVGTDGAGQLLVHLAGDEQVALPPETPPFAEIDLDGLSAAGRIHHLLQLRQAGAVKGRWDEGALVEVARSMSASSAVALRRLADEALHAGWSEVFAQLPLRHEEKCWRAAHHAATHGDLAALSAAAERLPDAGYPARVALLWPFVEQVTAAPAEWLPLLQRWAAAGVPEADDLALLAAGGQLPAVTSTAVRRLAALGAPSADSWATAFQRLWEGAAADVPSPECSTWIALARYESGRRAPLAADSFPVVAPLPATMIDDLIDAGSLPATIDVTAHPDRVAILARLRPDELALSELTEAGHVAERARRYFLSRNDTALDALDDASPPVRRFQALRRARDGKEFDREALDPREAQLLQLAERARKATAEGLASSLPAPILADATLWPIFATQARAGTLQPSAEDAARFPEFTQWAKLQRVLGLLWAGDWSGAERLASELRPQLTDERLADECQNLLAFALAQMGHTGPALHQLSQALEGEYTEHLLVNACLLAAETELSVAAPYFSRLVAEAPTGELKVIALRRAVSVWRREGSDQLPGALVQGLRDVLGRRIALEDYISLLNLACEVDPKFVWSSGLPDLGGEYTAPRRYLQSYARFKVDDNYLLRAHVDEAVAVFKTVGRAPWLVAEVAQIRGALRDMVFVDFGTAVGAAEAIDRFLVGAPEMLEGIDYYLLAPQAGAHLAAAFQKRNEMLSDTAFKKFFFQPIDQFLANRATLDDPVVTDLADNFNLTLSRATSGYLAVARDSCADDYNALVERQRWDVQNRPTLHARMRRVLDRTDEHVAVGTRSLQQLRRLPISEEGRGRIRSLEERIDEWRTETAQLRRQFR